MRRGPITNQGPRLVRWAAVEATQRLPRASKQAAWFHRIADRRGTGIGRVAAAGKLLTLVYYACATARALPGPGGCGGGMNGSGAARRVLVCVMTPARRRGRPLLEPARLRPHSSTPPWRGEPMTGTRARAVHGQRLLAMELLPDRLRTPP